jgi:phosphoenolpyruvate carboxylase
MNASVPRDRAQAGDGAALAGLLYGMLLDIVQQHNPELGPVLRNEVKLSACSPEGLSLALRAQGIWFQLQSIAEQNATMRQRRDEERAAANGVVDGTFEAALAQAAAAACASGRC